jgi:hypothetical protein
MTRGRPRREFCEGRSGEVHALTDETRLTKRYTRKDGSQAVASNGCRVCNRIGGIRRSAAMAVTLKIRRLEKAWPRS